MNSLFERLTAGFLFVFFVIVGLLGFSETLASDDEPGQKQQQFYTLVPVGSLIAPLASATRTPTPINLGNFVWDDYDQDGRQDAGEPGLSGVTVQLWNSSKTDLLSQTNTNANGNYLLIAPLPGSYRIRVLLPHLLDSFSAKDQAGGDDTDDSDINSSGTNVGFTDVINIASNVISMTSIDAGVQIYRTPTPTRTPTPINIGNFVWDDYDQDGRQDAGEPGLSGITVQLWNSAKTNLIAQTTTNANGAYIVIAPLPGNYRIRVLLPNPMDSFSPKDQAGGDDQKDSDINLTGSSAGFTDVFNLANNVISTTIHDAGIVIYRTPTPTRTPTPINIGNFVWDDLDGDGRQDAGEPGLSGIAVQLWNSAKTQLLAQTVTGSSGSYTVVAPVPGSYRIRVLLNNSAHYFSPKNQAGGDDQKDSDINPTGTNAGFTDGFTLASNVISTTIHDAGVITPLVFQPAASVVFSGELENQQPIDPLPLVPSPTLPAQVNPNLCARFRLTSPLDGLPNGEATFYWDPVDAQDITYQITVLDEARRVLAFFTVENATSVEGDVSQRAIGGSFQLVVQISALRDGRVLCTDERVVLRAAPDPGAPSVQEQPNQPPPPTPRPTRPPRGG